MAVKGESNGFGRILRDTLGASRRGRNTGIIACVTPEDMFNNQAPRRSKASGIKRTVKKCLRATKRRLAVNALKYIVGFVVLFSLTSLMICLGLSVLYISPSQMQQALFEACLNSWNNGLHTLLALLTGSALSNWKKK